ncbi:hypothetical protein Tco_1568344 [Tanacetum coccineum]
MDAPTIPVFADSSEGNFEDDIDIGLDVAHPVPVVTDVFPVVTIVVKLVNHEEAFRGIHEYLQGVPIEEEMSTLRFKWDLVMADQRRYASHFALVGLGPWRLSRRLLVAKRGGLVWSWLQFRSYSDRTERTLGSSRS